MNSSPFQFIDIHYHAEPDLYQRKCGALDVGKQYQALKGAVVLKSHLGSTSIQATMAQNEGLPVFPSMVLNSINGGINYKAIARSLAEYQPVIPSKLIVDFPTLVESSHSSKLNRKIRAPVLEPFTCEKETLFSSPGKLKKEVMDVLKFACDHPIVLSTGHAYKDDVYALIEACSELNVPHLLLNQPANPMTGMKVHDLLEISQNHFVWTEQTALTYLLGYQHEEDVEKTLNTISRLIYSSDLGQTSQMTIEEWFITTQRWFSEFNLSTQRREEICLTNPWQLLKI